MTGAPGSCRDSHVPGASSLIQLRSGYRSLASFRLGVWVGCRGKGHALAKRRRKRSGRAFEVRVAESSLEELERDPHKTLRKQRRPAKRARKRPLRFAPRLDQAAREAGFASYAGYLRSRVWRDKRREALARDQWRCVRCEGRIRLQVHHVRYEKLGQERLDSLETLCERCHKGHHKAKRGGE